MKKLQKPVLPAPDADRVGRDVMKEVIPWVLQELPTFLKLDRSVGASGCLTRRAPVQINPSKEDKQKRQMTNYKEAWVLENCPVSIKQSKMYEAGGNALWLNPECWDENFLIPGPEASWVWLGQCARKDFRSFTGGSCGERIMFPVKLAGVWSRDVRELGKDSGLPSWYEAFGGAWLPLRLVPRSVPSHGGQ